MSHDICVRFCICSLKFPSFIFLIGKKYISFVKVTWNGLILFNGVFIWDPLNSATSLLMVKLECWLLRDLSIRTSIIFKFCSVNIVFVYWVSLSLDPPLELPSFYMTPSHRQVVFEGDSLPFQCMASYIDQDMQVLWYQDGRIVETDESQGIFVEKNMVHNCSLIAR